MSAGEFPSTQWSVVIAMRGDDEAGRAALAALCARYRAPLVAFARRRGHSPEEAEDLVQGLFVQLLERDAMARAQPERGRFRSFLLGCFTRYVADQRDHATAAKRGGGRTLLSLDADYGEAPAPTHGIADASTPETEYERRWALATLAHALAEVETAYASSGRATVFSALRGTLSGDAEPYAALAQRLGTSEGAIKLAAHRLRRRFARALRDTVAATVTTREEADDELRFLVRALG